MHLPGILSKHRSSSIFFLFHKELGDNGSQMKRSLLSTSHSPPVQASACLEMWRSTPFAVLLFCSVVMKAAFTLVLSQETHYCLSAACGGRWLDSACPGSPLTSNQSSLARAALTKIEQPFAYWYNRLSLNAADINFAPPLQRRYASTHR